MACGILEVHAAAAVVVVDLAGSAAAGVSPVLHATLADTPVDRGELVLGHQERVVLWSNPLALANWGVVQADPVVEPHGQERTEFLRTRQAKKLGEEVGRFPPVLRGDDG